METMETSPTMSGRENGGFIEPVTSLTLLALMSGLDLINQPNHRIEKDIVANRNNQQWKGLRFLKAVNTGIYSKYLLA